jgi:hypothetical protein
VEKGETINQIQKYHVTYDIYKLNPDAQSGLKPNSVLLIGKQSVATTPVASASNECSSLAYCCCQRNFIRNRKTYNISDEDLKKANPFLEKTACNWANTPHSLQKRK